MRKSSPVFSWLSDAVARPCTSIGSATALPTVIRGLSELKGSWNTICMRRRSGRSSSSLNW